MKTVQSLRAAIEETLGTLTPGIGFNDDCVVEAVKYSLLGGGKRLRALIVAAIGEDLCRDGYQSSNRLLAGCAIEMLHAASLVHDDLPALDNDDERRGRPSCHKKFSEGVAVLAGDLLIGGAFKVLQDGEIDALLASKITRQLAHAWIRLCVGQSRDISNRAHHAIGDDGVQEIRILKTGALFSAAAGVGALCAGVTDGEVAGWMKWGEEVGVLFQRIDDALDGEEDAWAPEMLCSDVERLSREVFALGVSPHKVSCTTMVLREFVPKAFQATFELAS